MRTALKLSTAAIMITLAGLAYGASGPSQADIDKLQKELDSNVAAVKERTKSLQICTQSQANCPIRLWVSQDFLSSTLTELLANRSFVYTTTGFRNRPNLDGGGALGCGWYVQVDAFSANLHIGSIHPQWDNTGGQVALNLSPDFAFSSQAQVAGHINGPPGPCSLFRWSCDCPIGGGVGTSVGVSASANDQLSLLANLGVSAQNLLVSVSQPRAKNINVNASIGLGMLGNVGFTLPFSVPASRLYNSEFPMAFGTKGAIVLPQGNKSYDINIVSPAVLSQNGGVVATFEFQFVWH